MKNKTFIDKNKALDDLRELQKKCIYSSFEYQAIVKAIEVIENQPNVFVDLDLDDGK